MKNLLAIILFSVAMLFAGCRLGPPDGRIVSVTSSTVGISIGQNSADAVPHIKLGYERITYNIVPTGSNVYAPAVLTSMALDNTFSHQQIDENFATGGATRDFNGSDPGSISAKSKALKSPPAAKPSTNALVIFDQTTPEKK